MTKRQGPAPERDRNGKAKGLKKLFTSALSGLIGAALVAFAPPAQAQEAQSSEPIVMTGGMLVSGLSVPPVHNATVVIEGERVIAAGPASEVAIPEGARVIDTSGQTMMPGLIDAHAHLFMLGYGNEADWFKWLETDGTKYSIEQIMQLSGYQMLMSGVTSAIDLGGNAAESISLRDRINRGEIAGPRLQVSGPLVTRRPFHGFPDAASAVITSPREGAETIDRLHKMGVDVVKLHAGLTRDDYFAIVKAAHANGMKVHAHLYDETSARNAFDAGVDVFQHMGSGGGPTYSDELVKDIAETYRPVVLTAAHRSWIYPDTVAFPERLQDQDLKSMFPADIWEAMQQSFKQWPSEGYFGAINRQVRFRGPLVRQWIESNAMMGVGTDSGTPMNFNTDGLIREMKALADEGMPPLEVIANTTRTNAMIMSKPDLGTIAPGQLADIIVVPGDPVYNNLTNLFHVQTVMKNGVIYKLNGEPTVALPL